MAADRQAHIARQLHDISTLPDKYLDYRGGDPLTAICQDLSATLEYGACQLYVVDREMGAISLRAEVGETYPVLGSARLQELFFSGESVVEQRVEEVRVNWAVVPIVNPVSSSHLLNSADHSKDKIEKYEMLSRCSLEAVTSCRSPESSVPGCLFCHECPQFGLLVVARTEKIGRADLSLLQIVANQIGILHGLARSRQVDHQEEASSLQQIASEDVFSGLNSGMMVLDSNLRILKANPYACELLEITNICIEGRSVEELLPGFKIADCSGRCEYRFVKESGDEVEIGYNVSELSGDSGENTGVVLLFRDLTEIIQARKRMQHQERFTVLGEMTSWVAHEVKNPLFGIRSIAEILVREEGESVRGFAETILGETARLTRLVTDLLDYSKPIELRLEKIQTEAFIDEILKMLGSEAESLQTDIEIAENIDEIYVDRDRATQVLLNVLRNSIEAGADSLQIVVAPDGSDRVLFSLEDNGSGIRATVLDLVLKPFFTTKTKGTGLGLAISRKIVEEHGGEITIHPVATGGTRVEICFPLLAEK